MTYLALGNAKRNRNDLQTRTRSTHRPLTEKYFVCDVLNILLHATRPYNFVNDNISSTNPVSANAMLHLLFFGMELRYTVIQGSGKEICERMDFVDNEMRSTGTLNLRMNSIPQIVLVCLCAYTMTMSLSGPVAIDL